MKLKINYNECITNLSCSIRRYFGLEYKHNTLDYVDKLLDEKKPKNVILMLFDGMGANILDRTLNEKNFLIKNKYKNITSVFPTTTTAVTTSVLTGLNPKEHGWLGWNMYVAPINKTITLFMDFEKGKEKICNEFIEIKSKLEIPNIVDEINNIENFSALKLYPFGSERYTNLDEMISLIEKETLKVGKKFIYAYDDEPDSTMHDFGPDSNEVKLLIQERNDKIEKLCNNLKDSIIFIIADHGQIKVDNIQLEDYPNIFSLLERTTSIENRAVSFKIKDGYHKEFEKLFDKEFGKYFNLMTKDEIINNDFFGPGEAHDWFESAIGDYIAIANESNKAILTVGNSPLYSMHGGNSNDEVYVPLIIIDKS